MSTRAVKGYIARAHKAGGPVKVSYDEAPALYASKIVRKNYEIDSHETSALKVEIADLKAERDRYKNICMSGGSKVIIENLQSQNQIYSDKILELKEVVEVKKVAIDKLKSEKSDLNEKLREIYRGGYDVNLVDKLENMRDTIMKMSKINMELRFEINKMKSEVLNKAVDTWTSEIKSENK